MACPRSVRWHCAHDEIVHRLIEEPVTVLAHLLGRIHGDVGEVQQLGRITAVDRRSDHPDARAHCHLIAAEIERLTK